MTPEQIQHYVGFGIAVIVSVWIGYFVGYMRGYRAARVLYAEPLPLNIDLDTQTSAKGTE